MSSPVPYRFPGPRPFRDTGLDRKLFKGRRREIHALLHLILAEKLVVVFGRPGTGKSSLLNAGILKPLRRRGFFPMVVRVSAADWSQPAEAEKAGPIDALYMAIDEAIQYRDDPSSPRSIDFRGVPNSDLERLIDPEHTGEPLPPGELFECCRKRNQFPLWKFFNEAEFWNVEVLLTPLLVIDQFEELLTLDPSTRRDFVKELTYLIRGRRSEEASAGDVGKPSRPTRYLSEADQPALKIVLVLREDCLGALEDFAGDVPGILNARYRLGRLKREQAKQAITIPAQDEKIGPGSFEIREQAVAAIVGFLCQHWEGDELVETEEVEPFQLQLICQHLETIARGPDHSGIIGEKALGGEKGMRRIFQKFYEIRTSKGRSRRRARRIRKLCERGLIKYRLRNILGRKQIEKEFGVTPAELGHLREAQLLRAVPRPRSIYYELSHDTLVRPILASRKRRLRRLYSWAIPPVAALLIGTCFSLSQWNQHKRLQDHQSLQVPAPVSLTATVTELAQQPGLPIREAIRQPEGLVDPVLSLIESVGRAALAREKFGALPPDIGFSLSEAVELAREEERFELRAGGTPPTEILASAFIANGETLLDGDAEGALLFRAVESGAELSRMPLHQKAIKALAISADGNHIATGAADGGLVVSDSGGNARWKMPAAHQGAIIWTGFEPAGGALATLDEDGTVRFRRLADGGSLYESLAEQLRDIVSLAFFEVQTEGRPHLHLVTADSKNELRVWDVEEEEQIGEEVLGEPSELAAVAIHPEGTAIATASSDGTLRLWDRAGKAMSEPFMAHPGGARAVVFDPTGACIASSGADHTARIWDLKGKPLSEPFVGHLGEVTTLAFGPYGERIVTGSADWTVRVWAREGRQVFAPFREHQEAVRTVAFTPDGQQIVSGAADGEVWLWDPQRDEGNRIARLDSAAEAVATALSPDGNLAIAIGGADGKVWSWSSERLRELGNHQGSVLSVAFNPDGKRIASGGRDDLVQVWGESTQRLAQFGGFSRYVTSVGFTAAGQILIAGSFGGTVKLLRTPQTVLESFEIRHHYVTSLASAHGEARIVSGSSDGSIQLWEWNPELKLLRSTSPPTKGDEEPVRTVAISPDDRWIVSASEDGTLRLWDRGGHLVLYPLRGHDGRVLSLAFDGETLISRGTDGIIRRWDIGQPAHLGEPFAVERGVIAASFIEGDPSEGESERVKIISGDGSGTVQIWELPPESAEVRPLSPSGVGPLQLAEAPEARPDAPGQQPQDGSRFAALGFSADGTTIVGLDAGGMLRIWSREGRLLDGPVSLLEDRDAGSDRTAATREEASQPDPAADVQRNGRAPLAERRIRVLANNVNGTLIASGGSDGAVQLYDREDNRVWRLPGRHRAEVLALALSPDGILIASGGAGGEVRLWNWRERTLRSSFEAGDGQAQPQIRSLAFSPAGDHLAAGGSDGTVRRWSLDGEKLGKPFVGHNGPVDALSFNPDGESLVSGGTDATLRLWDLEGNQIVHPMRSFAGPIAAMTFLSGRDILLTRTRGGTLQLWWLGQNWLEMACKRVLSHSPLLAKLESERDQAAERARQLCQ